MFPVDTLLFSVVVPFLNEERWLDRCLSALHAQDFDLSRVEFLFIDNGSTDRSAEIIRRYPAVRLLHEEQRDPYLARNRGIANARGRYIVLLDADCIPEPGWLSALAMAVERQDAPIYLGYLAYPEGHGSRLLERYEHYYDAKLRYLLQKELYPYYFGHAGNMVVHRNVFEQYGPFPPMPVVGDTEIIHRLLSTETQVNVIYVPEARVVHAEVESFGDCLKKLRECGVYSETFEQVSNFRTLPVSERLRVFTECVRIRRYGLVRAVECAAMLVLGWVWFVAGRAQRRLQSGKGAKNLDAQRAS